MPYASCSAIQRLVLCTKALLRRRKWRLHRACEANNGANGQAYVTFADLEWKLTYVGSAESEKYDQELDSVLVGPVVCGQYRFIFQVGSLDTDCHTMCIFIPLQCTFMVMQRSRCMLRRRRNAASIGDFLEGVRRSCSHVGVISPAVLLRVFSVPLDIIPYGLKHSSAFRAWHAAS